MGAIRHLLVNISERARVLEEEIGDPATLAKYIVMDSPAAMVGEELQWGKGGTEGW